MLNSRSHSKTGVKPEELVVKDPYDLVPYALIGWESSVDPRYTDFGKVEFLALHPTLQ